MNVIIATGRPVLINVIDEFEKTGKPILKVPYEEGIKQIVSLGLFNNAKRFG